jgi:hypothetical protein
MKKILYTLSVGVLVSSSFFTVLIPTANAVTASDWKAGRIIDDGIFTDANSMSTQEIQNFLNSQNPACDNNGTKSVGYYYNASTGQVRFSWFSGGTWVTTSRATFANRYNTYNQTSDANLPFTCLKEYYEVPKTTPGPGLPASNANGAPIPAGAVSAAQLISDAAKAYNISPKVLLVKLHTESAGPLTTDDWPFRNQYLYAMGAHCPDSGPGGSANCDSNYAGFSIQMREAAALLRWYLDNMTQSWWQYKRPYQTNNILWNVAPSGCGGGNVYLESKASAALYTYTPYQPNQAALNNMYGTGDNCSAYGNRNFWRVYSDWFGSTVRSLITTAGEGVYQMESGLKRPFPNEITFLSYKNKWSSVLTISKSEFDRLPRGATIEYNTHFRDGILVKSPKGGIYIVENGFKRPFRNEGTYLSYGYSWVDALSISDLEISLIPEGSPLEYNPHLRDDLLLMSRLGGIYRVENGYKRPFPNELVFISNHYSWGGIASISEAELSIIPDGVPMEYNVHYRDGILVRSPAGGIFVIDSGTKRPFPNEETYFSYSYKFTDALLVSNTELNLIPSGMPMPMKTPN